VQANLIALAKCERSNCNVNRSAWRSNRTPASTYAIYFARESFSKFAAFQIRAN
jgi:hypothetical protein